MAATRGDFQRFINRVHRRYLLLRALERMGLGMLLGCAAGLPLVVITIWRGMSPAPLSVSVPAIGTLMGFVWGLITRPSRLDSAMEADRQLDSADLLSSAMLVENRSEDSWAHAVTFEADHWCRSQSPSSVVLNRLGARAWGGIGLAAALMGVLALLPTYSVPSEAAQKNGNLVSLQEESHDSSVKQYASSQRKRSAPQQEPEDAHPNRMETKEDALQKDQSQTPATNNPSQKPDQNAANGNGESHTSVKNSNRLSAPQLATDSQTASSTGKEASGAGRSAVANDASKSAAGELAGGAPTSFLPPWKSDHWAEDVQRAQSAIDKGQVPAQYQDVIRAYFER